jgi:hypothetical protein
VSTPLEPLPGAGAMQQVVGGWLSALSARERRTLGIGAAALVLALLLAYGVLPFVRRWSAREALVAARTAQLARVRGLIGAESMLADAVRARESQLAARGPRPLEARTSALAASALHTALQSAALAGGVQLQRIDVADQGEGTSDQPAGDALPSVSATLVALGDVHGLAALLDALRSGAVLAEVTTLGVQATPGPRGEPLLQLTVGVRAPWFAAGSPR